MAYLLNLIRTSNDLERIRDLLEAGQNPNFRNDEGDALLHILASKEVLTLQGLENSLQVARELISSGARVNIENSIGRTPLMHAVRAYNFKMVEFLLQEDADINHKDNNRNSAMHHAVLIDSLSFQIEGITISKLRTVETLARFHPDLDVLNEFDETPLRIAVDRRELPIIQCLLKHNASVNFVDSHRESALHHAVRYVVNVDIVFELLRYGGDFSLQCINTQTPLGYYIINLTRNFHREVKIAKSVFKIFILLQNTLSAFQQEDVEIIDMENYCRLTEFIEECTYELNKMLRDELAPNYFIHNIALRGFLKSAENDVVSDDVFDKVLDKIIEGEYPIYSDQIVNGISKSYLNKKFPEICLVGNTGREFFNSKVLNKLSFYLSHSEMLSMMVACSAKNKWDLTSHIWNIASLLQTDQ